MSSVYELTGTLMLVQQLLTDGEEEEEVIRDTLEAVQGEYDYKIEGCCKVIKNIEADINAYKAEAKRLTDRAKSLEKNIERLKATIFNSMKATNTTNIKGQLFKISIAKNGGKLPVVYDKSNKDITALLPDQLVNIVETPNLEAIRELLEAGKVVEGFSLGERGESLRIK